MARSHNRQPRKAPPVAAAPFRCRLVIMAKLPVAGRVKTRLAQELGVATATWFARHAIADTVARVRPGPWQTVLAVAPDTAIRAAIWPSDVQLIAQGRGELGARMQRIMDHIALGPLVIIGTDIPGIRAAHVRHAFHLLARHDAVVGPAMDGGYWLIGMRRRPRVLRIFARVRWSSPNALADTLKNLAGRSVAHIAMLGDIDSAEDMAANRGVIGRRVLPIA